MDKFIDINLIDALHAIMKTNTADFKTDFNYDIDTINRVAKSNDPQEKTVLWLSHFSGTNCDTERQTFMQKTEGNINWCSFEGYRNERILAYAAEVGKIDDNGIVTGDLYELDYQKHVSHVRADSITYNEDIKTIFFKDGYVNQVSPEDALHIVLHSKEDVSYFRDEPENPVALEKLLRYEKVSREQSFVIGNFDEHIQRLQDGRIAFEANRIAAVLMSMTEPNSPDKKGFIIPLSAYFSKTASVRDLSMLAKAIPFKAAKICSINGSKNKYAIISTRELTQNHKQSVLGQIEDGKKNVAQAGNTHKNTTKQCNEQEV